MQTETPSAPLFVTSTLPPPKALVLPSTATPSAPNANAGLIGTTAPTPTFASDCKAQAILLEDVTIPDDTRLPAREAFTKTWRFKNAGTCLWTNYTINYVSGERMNAPTALPVPETAAGGTVDLSVDLTAPMSDGTYTTYFSLQSPTGESVAIGAEPTFYVKVIVGTGGASVGNVSDIAQSPSTSSGSPAVSIGNINISCQYNYSENAGYVQELAYLINQARVNAGLSALNLNFQLTQAAQGHSTDMACNNFLSHAGSDGSRFGALVQAVGFPFSFQEIIAIGTPQNAMDQWAADPGHWEIVLNALATEMGIGYAYNANSNYGGYFTVDIH